VDAGARWPLREAVRDAERVLADAGVASPRADAELLAAHVLGIERTRLPLVTEIAAAEAAELRRLVGRRAERVPLQHLTGWAAMGGICVDVGPGVFVPRPETEQLFAWALAELQRVRRPLVVDLCAGSGVLGLAVANARPDAAVHAVERDPAALAWARRNANARAAAGDTRIWLHAGDVADPGLLADIAGSVDLVLCNPPYVPPGTEVPPEVAEHDPERAVFAPDGGLAVIRHVVAAAARLLRPGGAVGVEHDDSHGEAVPALLSGHGAFTGVSDHTDLAGRPRFGTATRRSG
jgi:release factor glutamine methyltransferase